MFPNVDVAFQTKGEEASLNVMSGPLEGLPADREERRGLAKIHIARPPLSGYGIEDVSLALGGEANTVYCTYVRSIPHTLAVDMGHFVSSVHRGNEYIIQAIDGDSLHADEIKRILKSFKFDR